MSCCGGTPSAIKVVRVPTVSSQKVARTRRVQHLGSKNSLNKLIASLRPKS